MALESELARDAGRRARGRGVVGDRCAAARADGARASSPATRSSRRPTRSSPRPASIVRARRAAGASSTSIPRRSTSTPRQIAAAITPRTTAILPVHLFGLSADMDPILGEGARAGVPDHRRCGAGDRRDLHGRAGRADSARSGCFSFFPSKNLGAFGDAGLLTTERRRPRRAGAAAAEPRHGAEVLPPSSIGGELPHGRAAGGGAAGQSCRTCAAWTEARRLNAPRYARLFGDAGLTDRVASAGRAGRTPPHLQPIRHPRSASATRSRRIWMRGGIGNEIYYPVPFHLQPCFAELGYRAGDFPHAETAAPSPWPFRSTAS